MSAGHQQPDPLPRQADFQLDPKSLEFLRVVATLGLEGFGDI
jgi:hypothetical protein